MNIKLFAPTFFLVLASASAQTEDWELHKFEPYHVQFKTPPHWQIEINTTTEKSFIECSSRDNDIYFFLTVAENEKKSEPDIILSYLKVTYTNCEFIREETKTINDIDFIFTIGINSSNDISTYIRLGVGRYKDKIYMIDSGFSQVDSDRDEKILDQIIASIKHVK